MKKTPVHFPTWVILGTGGILLIPLIAQHLDVGVHWTIFDFLVAASLLLTTGLLYEFFTRKLLNPQYKFWFGLMLLLLLGVVWIELAVGIFG